MFLNLLVIDNSMAGARTYEVGVTLAPEMVYSNR
jgi:hypothetical protein